MKKKIILLSVCIILLFSIFIKDLFAKDEPKTKQVDSKEAVIQSDGILRAEVFRLVSYLFYTDSDRSKLSFHITFEDVNPEDWCYEYIESVYQSGFENLADEANNKYYIRPTQELNGYEANLLFQKIGELFEVKIADLYRICGVDLSNRSTSEVVSRRDFLRLYENLLTMIPKEKQLVKQEQLYILEENEENHVITQKGEYIGGELFYVNPDSIKESTQQELRDYIDKKLNVYTSENRILYVNRVVDEETLIENAYLIHGNENELTAFICGCTKKFQLQAPLTESINGVVGNLMCKEGVIEKISIKPDQVSDKVILAKNDYIELEKYGKVEYDDNFRIYKVYGELAMEPVKSILVGYSNTQFVLSENKICAALITQPIDASNVRVLLKTNQYKSIFHDFVTVTCKKPFYLYYGDEKKEYKAGKKVTIKKNSKYLEKGRITFQAKDQESPIKVLSIIRDQGNPSYRGKLEVKLWDEGLTVINDLSVEEYLYAVVPSEMPNSYGEEALKTQAVCARTYVYKQLLENSYHEYGAHIDDSVSYQVYNNISETKESKTAVKETYGQVIEYEGDIITAYYFSTSWGHTSSISDVWGSTTGAKYLTGAFQGKVKKKENKGEKVVEVFSSQQDSKDFSKEKAFREFLKKNSKKTLEQNFAWYRWNVKMSYKNITENINKVLKKRYEANPAYILTKSKKGEKETYLSKPIETIGDVEKIEVQERKQSGIVTAILIHGSKDTILVKTEYNIRALLAPTEDTVIRQDDSKVKHLTLLPSAFFAIDEKEDGVKLTGGGYGHGVGMSQNGVKALSDLGYSYEEIIGYYYRGTNLKNIYK